MKFHNQSITDKLDALKKHSWNDPYKVDLCIADHLQELLDLWRSRKSGDNMWKYENQLMDLMVLLLLRFSEFRLDSYPYSTPQQSQIYTPKIAMLFDEKSLMERINKFSQKAGMNK